MTYVSEKVKEAFQKREEQVLSLIQTQLPYLEIGIFGSYARGDYKATSDIDFLVLVEEHPDHRISGAVREIAEELGADICFATPAYFSQSEDNFAKKIRKDYRCLKRKESTTHHDEG